MNINKAIYQFFAQDPEIGKNFAQWDFGDSKKKPAIFTIDSIPAECAFPVMTIEQGSAVWGQFDRLFKRGEIPFKISIYGDKRGSNMNLRNIAWLVFQKLHENKQFVFDEFEYHSHQVTTPEFIKDDKGFPGYSMDLNILVNKNF